MIGVILWSDPADQKAVIWCEDQGDLAFLSNYENIVLPDTFFEVGEVVQFDVQTRRNMRLVTNPARVDQNWGSTLGDGLRAIRTDCFGATGDHTASVIPFRPDHGARAPGGPLRHEKRHG